MIFKENKMSAYIHFYRGEMRLLMASSEGANFGVAC